MVTVIGTLPEISPREHLSLDGHWVKHEQHGTQISVKTCRQMVPATREGIERYLGSGGSPLDLVALAEYALTVGSSTRAFLAAVVTRLAQELEQLAKDAATPGNIDRVQHTVFRAQALQNAI